MFVIVIFLVNIDNSFAEDKYEIEYKILPEKIHQNDIIFLELYYSENGQAVLEEIQDLSIESTDTSIIEIIDFEKTHDFKTLVKLRAISEGNTNLYIFAEGTLSLEIPITVNGNNLPKDISLDIFPDSFELGKNSEGILSILLMDEGGTVTKADKDYLIKINTSKPGIISLSDSTLIISKGEYGVKHDFTVINEGDITMTIKSEDFEDSEIVTVNESEEKELSLTIFPKEISSTKSSVGHLIVQLTSNGELIKATKDMTIFYEIESDTEAEIVNTSTKINSLNPKGFFQIKKGQTYGHEIFSIQKGATDGYTIIVSSQDPLTIIEDTFETLDVEYYGDEIINFESLSVLADGNRQLIGAIYLKDENGHPVTANRDIVVSFISPDKSISVEPSIIKEGFETALVYGNMGVFIPTNTEIAPNIENFKVTNLDIHGTDESAVSLSTHIPTEHFLIGEKHWIIVYMEAGGELFEIPDNQHINFSDSEIFKVDKEGIEKYQNFMMVPITAIDVGDEDIIISSDKFETTISLSSIISKPDLLEMKYSDTLFNGIKDMFTIQILDAQGKPIKISEDVEIKVFSSDPSIINFPKTITIPQKSSFVSLDITPEKSGEVEISLVSKGLDIVTEVITIEDLTPSMQITSADLVDQGESFMVSILAMQNGIPLKNANIIWELDGGFSTMSEEKTGPTGEAIASIISTSENSVKISATIDNGPFQSAFASKIIRVNASSIEIPIIEEDKSFKKPSIEGIDPIIFIIPALIGGVVIYMKKKKSK